MGFFILLLFIAVPIVEISVFIQVGDVIGLWPTIAIVILTALMGTAMLRQQGLSTLMRAQSAMNEGRLPATELFDGLCLVIAGAFLLTPGFCHRYCRIFTVFAAISRPVAHACAKIHPKSRVCSCTWISKSPYASRPQWSRLFSVPSSAATKRVNHH